MGLKYFCEYRTLNTQELWRVEIDMPDYEGTPIEKMAAAEQACIIDHSGGDMLLEKFAIGSSASITLLFSDDAEVRELQLLGDKTSKVRVYRNGGTQLFWQGYLISDGIQFPDSGVMTPITLTAIDMLEASNDIPFANISAEAVTVDGQEGADNSPLNWIRKCLINPDNIDNRLPIRWSCSLKNLQYPSDDFFAGRTGFIPNFDVFISSRQETSVGWMLENIAKSAGCLFFQYGGYWYLVSLVDLSNNSSLNFYEINGDDLSAKTASIVTLSLSAALPTKLNESTFSMVQKPISKVRATYNHSMPSNIIPNGGFDITDSEGKILYWNSDNPILTITPHSPINNRSGKSAAFKNNAVEDGSVFFGINGVNSIPVDANILFKDMQWGFTFMPVSFPQNIDGIIDWSSNPLEISVMYTGYYLGILRRFFLNEFGYWYVLPITPGSLSIENIDETDGMYIYVKFSGGSIEGQIFNLVYFFNGDIIQHSVFLEDATLSEAVNKIALETGGTVTSTNDTVVYHTGYPITNFSAEILNWIDPLPKISFNVDGLKNNDIASVQFQTKGNQGRVLMPDPGVLDINRALESGRLSVQIFVKGEQEVVFEDLYMNVSDNKEFWEISDAGTDGKAEYELEISSSFSGFMTSSYMDNFAKSDLSMIMDNGTDKGTLTEIFGKTALRLLSSPTEKIDTEIEGIYGLLNLFSYKSLKFLPLKSTINTETNSSRLTIFELNYDDGLELTSVHKSTGDGDNSSFSTGGYGGGSSGSGGGGAEFLFELGDVSLSSPSNGQALVYNSSLGKWVNAVVTPDLTPYALRDASNINVGNYQSALGINTGATLNNSISGSATLWNGLGIDWSVDNQSPAYFLAWDATVSKFRPANITGTKTALNISDGSTLNNNINGNAVTVTNGVYTTGSYSNPSWITSLAYGKLTGTPTALSQFTNDLGNYGNWITKAQGDTYYQPLENQRLSTGNNVAFAGVNVADFLTIPTSVSSDAATNGKWQVYIDVSGTGGGGVAPPVVVNLTDLQDVAISSPTNGQALTYNSTTGKWVNTNIVTDLSNYYTKSESDARFKPIGYVPSWGDVTGKPTNFVFNDGSSYNIDVNSWNGQAYSSASANAGLTYLMGYNGTTSQWSYYNSSNVKTFLNIGDGSTLANNISGNAATVTNGVYTTGSYSNPSWLTSLSWGKITGTPTTLSGYGITDAYPLSGNPSGFLTTTTAGALYEPIFSKNTAFNKNFGTSSGTVAEGNDSRINNGQTAYSWGNHASAGYALANGSNATGTWGININGSSSKWGGYENDFSTINTNVGGFATWNGTASKWQFTDISGAKSVLGLPSSGGYDLQGVTDRGNTTTNGANFGGKLTWGSGVGATGIGEIYNNASLGTILIPKSGTTSDFLLTNGSGSSLMQIPTGTLNVEFFGVVKSPTITATAQMNIPVESAGVATGNTWKLFVEL